MQGILNVGLNKNRKSYGAARKKLRNAFLTLAFKQCLIMFPLWKKFLNFKKFLIMPSFMKKIVYIAVEGRA